MGFMDSLDLSSSGMTAERLRMDVISNNLANVDTTHGPNGQPFRRENVVLATGGTNFSDTLDMLQSGDGPAAIEQALGGGSGLSGVHVEAITPDMSPFREEYDPGNPDADKRGYVKLPNVSAVTEMVDMMGASRAYEANVTAVQAAKGMAQQALNIGKA